MKFNEFEESNILFLQNLGIPYATVRLTENILKHSIFDANSEIRSFLQSQDLHDYEKQGFGQEFKTFLKTQILTFKRNVETKTSLYRAGTRGDYRMWFGSVILKLSNPNDLFMITAIDKELYTINLSKIDLELCYTTSYPNPIKNMFLSLKNKFNGQTI